MSAAVPFPPVPDRLVQDIVKDIEMPTTSHLPMEPTRFPNFELSIYTDIGGRKYQEDRFAFSPTLLPNRKDCAFFGVFDGTVGDFASDTVKSLVVPHLLASPGWRRAADLIQRHSEETPGAAANGSSGSGGGIESALREAVDTMYRNSDIELVHECALNKKDYASSTSVTAVLAGGYLAVGHLGDSRIALGRMTPDGMKAEFLTNDHKPDQPEEKERILRSGGSVEYLHNHNNKPFIRGGDFTMRKSRGEQPMQLQYSRAFGGKDLKRFGLSHVPDVRVVTMDESWRCLILASDGLWDVLSADHAVDFAMSAKAQSKNPAQFLVTATLEEQRVRNQSADNITAMVAMFH
eukprot:GHVS01057290.1.p1 GENE.GHVS01057290.1~~GHVS01057290.1.p1  ORF type:complete len:349 (+),score=53.40 GHVS01057290.1:215-1261(+)